MKLENVYEIEYSEPGNMEDFYDSCYFDDENEVLAEFEKQLKEFKRDIKDAMDDVTLILRHNGKFVKGYRNNDGKIEEM